MPYILSDVLYSNVEHKININVVLKLINGETLTINKKEVKNIKVKNEE